jgi:hypothetical protein
MYLGTETVKFQTATHRATRLLFATAGLIQNTDDTLLSHLLGALAKWLLKRRKYYSSFSL